MIAIKDMEMPETCAECRFRYWDWDSGHLCPYTLNSVGGYRRDADCPLIEVKEKVIDK